MKETKRKMIKLKQTMDMVISIYMIIFPIMMFLDWLYGGYGAAALDHPIIWTYLIVLILLYLIKSHVVRLCKKRWKELKSHQKETILGME